MQQLNNQQIGEIHNLTFTDSKMVEVNFRFQVDFEDLSDMIEAGQLLEGASVIFIVKGNSLDKFHKRINYLFFNTGTGLYLKHDPYFHEHMNKNEYKYECYRIAKYERGNN